jgi:asparagine synthase (glutamine-hydrolysing)
MRSDVRYGAFLSGGLDSSLMVALMAQQSSKSIETFQIAFKEDEFDERQYARIIAKKYQTDHHEIELSASDFLNEIPHAVASLDFPSGDGPNTYVVSKATREAGLKVAISGLGGDELFAGYPVFKHMHAIANNRLLHFPHFIRKAASYGLSTFISDRAGQKKVELLGMKHTDAAHVFPLIRKVWDCRKLNSTTSYSPDYKKLNHIFNSSLPFLSKVSSAEMEAYMQHVLLRDSDQMSMAHALEIRVPFLDHRVVELALSIPDDWKFPHTPKQFLTQTFSDLLPNEIVHRKKMGFTLPWNHWMKNELQVYCTEGLQILVKNQLLQSTILQEWNNFLKGNTKLPFTAFWHLVVLGHWIQNNHIEVEL